MNNNILNRFFSKTTMTNILNNSTINCYGEIIKRYSLDASGTNKEIISSIYHILSTNYRNEYFYKNTLLNNLIIKKHKIRTTKVFTEFVVGKAIADFVTLNGKAVVYEIKTELDNLERIDNQISEYYKCFPYVCIVTCLDHLEEVKSQFEGTCVGIYYFTKRNAIKIVQEPIANYANLNYESLFKILRKSEFEQILIECDIDLPKTNDFDYYKECLKRFSTINMELICEKILSVLKKRNHIKVEKFNTIPNELKMLVYSTQLDNKQYEQLNEFLDDSYNNEEKENVFSIFER